MEWYVLSGCEVMHHGTKKECLEYYDSLPNPFTMTLLTVKHTETLSKKKNV